MLCRSPWAMLVSVRDESKWYPYGIKFRVNGPEREAALQTHCCGSRGLPLFMIPHVA